MAALSSHGLWHLGVIEEWRGAVASCRKRAIWGPRNAHGRDMKRPLQQSLSRSGAGGRAGGRSGRGNGAARARAAVAQPLQASDDFVAALLRRIPSPSPSASASSGGESAAGGGDAARDVLQQLQAESRANAGAMHWPSRKDEAFRFTDLKPLQGLELVFERQHFEVAGLDLQHLSLGEPAGPTIVTVDGVWQPQLSSAVDALPRGLVVARLSDLPPDTLSSVAAPALGRVAAGLDVFTELNGASASDVLVIVAREGAAAHLPIHVIHVTSASGSDAVAHVANPRVLVVAEEGAEVEVVEEFIGLAPSGKGSYWTNAVAEVVVRKGARVLHGVVQRQDKEAFHIKTTAVQQAEGSQYSLIEAQLGARVSRHTLRMKQLGPDTETHVSTFSLCGARQLHDLHSSLILDHPRGVTRQLHKCIVADATGQGVFDGNVQVNRFAQQTDAGQLTRSLLLAPRGTVNVKPNLQIVADDVKCTHGAAISDLDDEQLFYFQARGIDEATARSALVFSFAAEIVEKFPYGRLRKRLESALKATLASQGAMDSHVAAELQGGSD